MAAKPCFFVDFAPLSNLAFIWVKDISIPNLKTIGEGILRVLAFTSDWIFGHIYKYIFSKFVPRPAAMQSTKFQDDSLRLFMVWGKSLSRKKKKSKILTKPIGHPQMGDVLIKLFIMHYRLQHEEHRRIKLCFIYLHVNYNYHKLKLCEAICRCVGG